MIRVDAVSQKFFREFNKNEIKGIKFLRKSISSRVAGFSEPLTRVRTRAGGSLVSRTRSIIPRWGHTMGEDEFMCDRGVFRRNYQCSTSCISFKRRLAPLGVPPVLRWHMRIFRSLASLSAEEGELSGLSHRDGIRKLCRMGGGEIAGFHPGGRSPEPAVL